MNPFKYGRVVFGQDFCPRPKLEKQLNDYIAVAQNVLLEGERRTGKTSLVYEILRRIGKTRPLYIDLLEIKTIHDLCRRIISAIVSMEQKAGITEKIMKSLAHLRPSLSFDPMTGSPTLGIDAGTRLEPDSVEGLLDLIQSENQRKKVVVVFDEFQDILNLKESDMVLATLRGRIQFLTEIPFIFAGSVRGQMNQIFNDPQSAFFKSAVTVEVGPLDRDQFSEFLRGKFLLGKRQVTRTLLDKIFDMAQDIPGDVQQFCGAVWEVTSYRETIDDGIIPAALETIHNRELKGYEMVLAQVTGQQLRCLSGLAAVGGNSPLSAEFMKITGIRQPSSIKKALNRLVQLRIIYRYRNEYRFINPFFKTWLLSKNF